MKESRRLTSLADVAELAGVSVATASRVLSNSTYPVAPDTRRRVLDAAEELDFTPNLLARGLVARRACLVGLVVHDLVSERAAELARGVEDVATENGFAMIVRSTDGDPEREIDVARQFRSMQTDAVVYGCSSACHGDDELRLVTQLRKIEDAGGVLVRTAPHPAVAPDVSVSMREVFALAVGHLVALGHRDLALVSGPEHLGSTRVARHAMREVLERHGLEFDDRRMVPTDGTHAGGAAVAARVATLRCSAVATTSDAIAIGLLHGLAHAGIAIPDEVSVVGCDDVVSAAYAVPALTTIRVPLRELGATAVQTAIWVLGGGARMGRNNLPVELVVRESTGSARRDRDARS